MFGQRAQMTRAGPGHREDDKLRIDVVCEVHRGHAAGAELALDRIGVTQSDPEALAKFRICCGGIGQA